MSSRHDHDEMSAEDWRDYNEDARLEEQWIAEREQQQVKVVDDNDPRYLRTLLDEYKRNWCRVTLLVLGSPHGSVKEVMRKITALRARAGQTDGRAQ